MTMEVRRNLTKELNWDSWVAATIDIAVPEAGVTVAEVGIGTEAQLNHKAPFLEWESWVASPAAVEIPSPAIGLSQADVGVSDSGIDQDQIIVKPTPKPALPWRARVHAA